MFAAIGAPAKVTVRRIAEASTKEEPQEKTNAGVTQSSSARDIGRATTRRKTAALDELGTVIHCLTKVNELLAIHRTVGVHDHQVVARRCEKSCPQGRSLAGG